MQNSPVAPFKRGVIQPIDCIKSGWGLVRDQYWLFAGMSFVGFFLGSLVPFGIILGPMMCGIHMALFRRRRGEFVEFGILFKGFDYFGESVVATLIQYVPMVVIIIPFYIVLYGGMFLILPQQGEPDPSILFTWIAVLAVIGLVMMVLIIVLSVIFMFSYPLIVDRKMSGIEAAKLSARAGWANFLPLFGLLLLNGLITFGGLLLCYVGIFLALPVTFAAISVAYERVFGLGEGQGPILPPPPPSFT